MRLPLITAPIGISLLMAAILITIPFFASSAPITVGPCDLSGMETRSAADKSVNNKETCEAYQYLKSLPRKRLSNCAPPEVDANIDRLNHTFAVCAARFLKAYTDKYGGVIIRSAYRDGPSGANKCAGGATHSLHQSGLAMDINPADGNYARLWGFAQANPQLGVCFPYLGGDRPHMALAGINTGEAGKCKNQGISKTCSGTTFDPSSIRDAPAGLPSASASNAARSLLGGGLQAAAPAQPQAMCALPGGGQVPCSSIANPGGAQAGSQQSAPVGNPAPLPASQQIGQYLEPSISLPTSSSSSSSATSSGSKSSAFDGIEAIAEPSGIPGETSVSEILLLTLSGRDVQTLGNSRPPSQRDATSTDENINGNLALPSEQTFTSGDLRDSPPPATVAARDLSRFETALSAMKEVLLIILEYLKPFGRPYTEEHYDEEME